MYEFFEHTADLGLRVKAETLDRLFRDAATGLLSMIVESAPEGGPRQHLQIELRAERLDDLLFDWLNELLYLVDTKRWMLDNFEVRLEQTALRADLRARPLDPSSARMRHEVKAITYHRLKVEPTPGGWLAEVIVDI
jgi:SHS2 domain-containing protein